MPHFKRSLLRQAQMNWSRYLPWCFLFHSSPSLQSVIHWPTMCNKKRTFQWQSLYLSRGLTGSRPLRQSSSSNFQCLSYGIFLVSTPPVGHLFAGFMASPTQKNWNCSLSGSLSNHCDKRTCVNSQEVESKSEHRSTQGKEDMHALVLKARSSLEA